MQADLCYSKRDGGLAMGLSMSNQPMPEILACPATHFHMFFIFVSMVDLGMETLYAK